MGPVTLFYAVVDIMFFRSIVRWPEQITDKEILSQMYSITYRKIAEIQFELSKYFQSIKLGHIDPVGTLVYGRYHGEGAKSWGRQLTLYYPRVGMESEIRQVLDSIIKLNEDLKDLNLFELDIDYHSIIDDVIDDGDDWVRKTEKLVEELEMYIQKNNSE